MTGSTSSVVATQPGHWGTAIDKIAPDRILELGEAFRVSKTLLSAVELNVFTVLSDGPLNFRHLSKHIGLGPTH